MKRLTILTTVFLLIFCGFLAGIFIQNTGSITIIWSYISIISVISLLITISLIIIRKKLIQKIFVNNNVPEGTILGTQSKKEEEILKRYQLLSRYTRDIILFIRGDGKIIEANEIAIKSYGYSREELLSLTIYDLRGPLTQDLVKDQMEEAGKRGILFETRHYRKDGTVFPVEVSSIGYNIGKDRVLLSIIRDITERAKQNEYIKSLKFKQLESQMKMLTDIFEAIPVGVLLLDENLMVKQVNDIILKMTGSPLEKIVGKTGGEGFGCINSYKYGRCGSGPLCRQCPFRKATEKTIEDGEPVVDLKINPELIINNRKVQPYLKINAVRRIIQEKKFIILTVEDITEAKMMEESLRKAINEAEIANRAKGDFLARMSHEIRTPMNGIIGMTDLLLSTEVLPKQKEYLQMVKMSANSLLTIINDILDFSKIEAGKMVLKKQEFNLKEVIITTIKTMAPGANDKGLEIIYYLEPDLPLNLYGDPVRLQQIFFNLVGNAIKFTNEGHVLIKGKKVSEFQTANPGTEQVMLEFSVTDTGIGIPEGKTEKLFKSFSQLDNSTTRSHGGTGLGLIISKSLVERMGGNIKVESKTGQGSTFIFSVIMETKDRSLNLQINDDPQIIKRSSLTTNKATNNNNSLNGRVLLAEDNLVNQKLIEALLENVGLEVTSVGNGLDVISKFIENEYDLILMDVSMPEMDGLEAARIIREKEKQQGGHIPIIALTAYAMKGDKEKFLRSGMDAYLAKPINAGDLYSKLEFFLNRHINLAKVSSVMLEDRVLMKEIARVFLINYPETLSSLWEQVKSKDCHQLEKVIHKFRGSISYFGAEKALKIADEIESFARCNNLDNIENLINELEEEMTYILEFLAEIN